MKRLSIGETLCVMLLLFTSHGAGLSAQQDSPATVPLAVAEPDQLEVSNDDDILDLDIDQLGHVNVVVPSFDVEVTSVTRQESTVGKSPAAVFVITPEMIRHSGVTSIPEALRMAPGVNVARIDSNTWAITSRGFNGLYANKLLVLIDGRSVYTPTFGGVYWDIQDTLLQDIQRIEVIRGPGATVWGANAVNGVINIITKKAQNTQGTLVTAGGGSEDRAITGGRYGGQLAPGFYYRVYGKYFDRDTSFDPIGANDDWHQGRAGFRADWNLDSCGCDTITFQGDYYQGASGRRVSRREPTPPFRTPIVGDAHVRGLNLLGRWTHKIDSESNYSLQAYYDRNVRNEPNLEQEVEVLDAEWIHQFPLACRHQITWGLRYRHVSDRFGLPSAFQLSLDPPSRQTNLYSAFVQDRVSLVDDVLDLTLGCKLEHNDFSGFEYQPTARLLWMLDERHVAWGSVSRAVRTPARTDDDFNLLLANIAPFPPTFLGLRGNPAVAAEDLIAYELGVRAQPTDAFSWDLALFFNQYSDLIIEVPGAPIPPPPALILPLLRTNGMKGETYGFEWAVNYQVTDCWRLYGAYSYLQMQLHTQVATIVPNEFPEGESPHNQLYIQSSWNLPLQIELDLMGRYVDNLPAQGIGSYVSLDARLGWRPTETWDISVVGQNLLEAHRREFTAVKSTNTEVDRGVYLQAVWRH